jgi:UDP-N-acetylmuramate--alanine ligase
MAGKHWRFLGIGGVGMSALAEHYHRQGQEVSGYDREPSPQTERLSALGIPIDFSPRLERVREATEVVYTPAIPEDFPELLEARRLGLRVLRRAEALAQAVESYQVLAVAGAHGKTSTSAILAWLLHRLGALPVAFVGGQMRNFGGTYLPGSGPYAVVEADEYDRAMLRLSPAHAIITSTEPDHLEIYGDAAGVLAAYQAFRERVGGYCVVPAQVVGIREAIRVEVRDYQVVGEGRFRFVYRWDGGEREVEWSHLGRLYAENAALALTLLEVLGFSPTALREALAGYAGVARRLEWQRLAPDLVAVLDYAHHPTEIARTIDTLREAFPGWQIIVLFQPHLFSRTAFFDKEFALVLGKADEVVLFPIYPAREPYTPHISVKTISQHLVKPAREVVALEQGMREVDILLKRPAVIVLMGAGDIYTLWQPLLKHFGA